MRTSPPPPPTCSASLICPSCVTRILYTTYAAALECGDHTKGILSVIWAPLVIFSSKRKHSSHRSPYNTLSSYYHSSSYVWISRPWETSRLLSHFRTGRLWGVVLDFRQCTNTTFRNYGCRFKNHIPIPKTAFFMLKLHDCSLQTAK